MSRVCKVCGEEKPIGEFRSTLNRHGKRYHLWTCRSCEVRQAVIRNRQTPREVANARARKWKAENRERHLAAKRAQDEARRRRLGMKKAIRRPPIDREMDRFDRKHVRALRHIARGTIPRYGWTDREIAAWRQRNDPRYALNQRMRNAIRKALRGGKQGRRWESLVGYTHDDLAAHMQRQMPRGYSMKDFGTGRLHIDHIVPKWTFDVTDPEQLRACWALPNLRPVPAVVNLRKGGRRVTLL